MKEFEICKDMGECCISRTIIKKEKLLLPEEEFEQYVKLVTEVTTHELRMARETELSRIKCKEILNEITVS